MTRKKKKLKKKLHNLKKLIPKRVKKMKNVFIPLEQNYMKMKIMHGKKEVLVY